jgi:hypothetical protein
MNNSPFRIVLWFLLLYALQIMVFKMMTFRAFGPYHVEILIFPLFIATLSTRTIPQVCILIGMLSGLLLDISYDALGIHAATGAFVGYIRFYALRQIEPKGGFGTDIVPGIRSLGLRPYLIYYSIFLGLYMIFYYFMVEFTPFYLFDILVKSALSFLVSMVFGVLLSLIVRL